MPFSTKKFNLNWLGEDNDGVVWWELGEGFFYTTPSGILIEVPSPMITDLASIPKPLQCWLSPAGPYMPAALVHDLLYARHRAGSRIWTKDQADNILMAGMVDLGVGWFTRQVVYDGVRIGGDDAWNRAPRPVG
jgi:hypothetical protein